jgi:hypothetical protein
MLSIQIDIPKQRHPAIDDPSRQAVEFVDKQDQRFLEKPSGSMKKPCPGLVGIRRWNIHRKTV